MKKLSLFLLGLILCLGFKAKADEGMWLPLFIDRLNYVDMQKMGLRLTAEEIYSVNNSSLKDAIVLFGNGCTGEIISGKGLLLTNHHCGYGAIQSQSTVEMDYLTNGFWAHNYKEELPIAGLSVKFLVRIEDVTQKVNDAVAGKANEDERNAAIKGIYEKLQKEATAGTNNEAVVKSFFEGNEFYLFVYQVYKDIRLVGAPPVSIGKFGGETDNWMWPRHTGDFSMFRVYGAADGSPSEYSESNVPITPKHSLPISIKGVKKDDFAMILGYPGTTERYLTSYGIDFYTKDNYPVRIMLRGEKLAIMREDMKQSPLVKLQYSSKYAGISNYYKNFIGVMKALDRLNVADKKKQLEEKFTAWVNADPARIAKYGQALTNIAGGYEEQNKYILARLYFMEAITGCEGMMFSKRFESLAELLKAKPADKVKIDAKIKELKEGAVKFFKDYNAFTDQKTVASMLKLYYDNVPKDQQPLFFTEYAKKFKYDFTKMAATIFAKSIFTDKAKIDKFMLKPSAKGIEGDISYQLIKAFFEAYNNIGKLMGPSNNKLAEGKRLFVAGLREMQTERTFYPDANQTMRLTYGKVSDYYPADAVHYNYYTTLDGIMEKEDPTSDEFKVPAKLKELYKNKDYGPYGENGVMKTDFLTDNDITGGNSGSPVINGKGQLIGLAFDGNWEAMSGNILFEPELQRTINMDIRYVLFIVDKFAGAHNLIEEMNIVKE